MVCAQNFCLIDKFLPKTEFQIFLYLSLGFGKTSRTMPIHVQFTCSKAAVGFIGQNFLSNVSPCGMHPVGNSSQSQSLPPRHLTVGKNWEGVVQTPPPPLPPALATQPPTPHPLLPAIYPLSEGSDHLECGATHPNTPTAQSVTAGSKVCGILAVNSSQGIVWGRPPPPPPPAPVFDPPQIFPSTFSAGWKTCENL